MPGATTLNKPKQMMVEGNDEARFFDALLNHLGITDVQVHDAGGNAQIKPRLKALANTPGFATSVISLGVIRDAEGSAASAMQSVRDALTGADMPVPPNAVTPVGSDPRVSYFILPNNADAGMLETLCLQAVAGDPLMPCVNDFLACLESKGSSPSNLTKARVQAFLASRHNLKRLLGEAAHANYWDWSRPAFDDIKAFLTAL